MPELRQIRFAERDKLDAERLARLAERQHGVVSARQLVATGLTRPAISRWTKTGRLHRIHPHVYALGHGALSLPGHLHAALLYAGTAAMLSHTTAAWLWGLIDADPTRIHLTVPGRRRSLPGVRIHHSRRVEGVEQAGWVVTPVARTLVDLAATVTTHQLRRALAEADYRGLFEPDAVRTVLLRGRPGSSALRAALRSHLPELAATLSVLEERFLELCAAAHLPIPEVNARVGRMRVDALWRAERLAVELDGGPAHGGVAAMKRDRDRELALRSMGFVIARYSWEQVAKRSDEVASDLRRLLRI